MKFERQTLGILRHITRMGFILCDLGLSLVAYNKTWATLIRLWSAHKGTCKAWRIWYSLGIAN